MTASKRRVGIIGAGTIGTAILQDILEQGLADVDYVADASPGLQERLGNRGYALFSSLEEALDRKVDLVIEAAMPAVLSQIATSALKSGDLCAFSCTALADAALEAAILAQCRASGTRFYVPHGAILALDGLMDGRDVIKTVTVTTSKSGNSLGADESAEGLLYDGPTRDACRLFPRNVNVHAAIALAGIGFDRTVSRVVAVPGQQSMEHKLEVTGSGFSWDINVSSRSLGGVTGAYTPRSAIGSIRRILGGAAISVA
jgi:aspartate dehydrogenase